MKNKCWLLVHRGKVNVIKKTTNIKNKNSYKYGYHYKSYHLAHHNAFMDCRQ